MTELPTDPIGRPAHPAATLPESPAAVARVGGPSPPLEADVEVPEGVTGSEASPSVWVIVPALVVASVVLRVLIRVLDLPASAGEHVVPIGIALAGGYVAVRWVRRGVRRQVAEGVSSKVAEFGGGIYGGVAFATLLYLEALDLIGDVAAAGSLGGFLGQLSFGWLLGQLLESVGFFVTAITWPWFWFSELGPATAGLVAGGVWAVNGVAPRLWKWISRRRAGRADGVAASEQIP